MKTRICIAFLSLLTILCLVLAGTPARAQQTLYDNGPDTGIVGCWPINYGHAVSNSFTLQSDSIITDVILSIWDVDDRNHPQRAKWKITTELGGGDVLASGESLLAERGYFNGQLWTVWSVEIQNMGAYLPAGTYYLEVYDVHTRWNTWAFWGESDGIGCTSVGCPSSAISSWSLPGMGGSRRIGSESFQIIGRVDSRSGQ
jgi:hypothetical protein